MVLSTLLRLLCCLLSAYAVYRAARAVLTHVSIVSSRRQSITLDDVLRDRSLCTIVFCAVALVVAYASSLWLAPLLCALAYLLARRAPHMLDERAKRELRSLCDENIDVMADIVAMGVRSGLSFDSALELFCSKFDNRLAHEMRACKLRWTSGLTSREAALEDLASRIGSRALKRFSETSLQAIHYGSPLAEMLAGFSRDIRQRRKSAVERQIEKAPIKLLIPTGTCILPAMLILVMGPVLIQFIGQGF